MRKNDLIEHLYSLIREYLSSDYSYHGIHHTEDVHRVTKFYIGYYRIAGKEAELLELAAVAHDLGFIETRDDHETAGANITAALMSDYGYNSMDTEIVRNLIIATSYPQKPTNFLEEILCDADLDYLGREDFDLVSQSLRKEWEHFRVFPELKEDFDRIQINFLKRHNFHTQYAIKHRRPAMQAHLSTLRNRQLYKKSESHFGSLKMRATA